MTAIDTFKLLVRKLGNVHRETGEKNIFVIAPPRGGSTWLMELISSQKGFKFINEPFNLRTPRVKQYLGMSDWTALYNRNNRDTVYAYLRGLSSGRISFLNPVPTNSFYRPFTHRTVFKMIHGGEDQLEWMVDQLNGHAIVLLRHPLAVSLSRKVLPRLEAFVHSDYRHNYTESVIKAAHDLIARGTFLEKGVLSWCFQNSLPLRVQSDSVTVITYEQLVLEPEKVVRYLNRRIGFGDVERILRQVVIPSGTVKSSTPETRSAIESGDREYMISKWKKKINEQEERELMKILDLFDLDIYQSGTLVSPTRWITEEN